MKKVLLVSPYPYSKTGRGMDVLTECFEEEKWETSHLKFPNVFYSVDKTDKFDTDVIEYSSKKALVPYVDGFMKWFPKWMFNLMVKYQRAKASFIDFSSYDYIVLESGKPLFLLDLIPSSVKIIYRQSDSVRHVLGKNRYYIGLEDRVYKLAHKIIVVKDRFKNLLDEDIRTKVEVIKNGYAFPQNIELVNPYKVGSKNAIYVGLTKLDRPTLEKICLVNKNMDVHIFGNCIAPWNLKKLNKIENFYYHGFEPRDIYLSHIKFADVAIFPFKPWDAMEWVGFTSKYLNFMYFKLPIVSYLTGELSEFDGMGVLFPKTAEEFALTVKDVIAKGEKVESNIDFNFYSHPQRKAEYKEFIKGCING